MRINGIETLKQVIRARIEALQELESSLDEKVRSLGPKADYLDYSITFTEVRQTERPWGLKTRIRIDGVEKIRHGIY